VPVLHKKVAGRILATILLLFGATLAARAQAVMGAINGTVSDTSGGVVPKVTVAAKNLATNLEVTAVTQNNGTYNIPNLPIGTYSVTFSKSGFKSEVHTDVVVLSDRAATVNATLQAGEVATRVTVSATPLLNQTDTTNGYVLSSSVIQSTPLGTGSFTQLATLSPGVSADLLAGSGTNTGLGNQNLWANGQRSDSNSFSLNGIDANNLYNGKSSSQVADTVFTINTGETFGAGGQVLTSTSIYNAIGQALPSPPTETLDEVRVNTSMYDASEGGRSGAQVAVITKSGTNDFHGQLYEYVQNTAFNANYFFFNANQLDRQPLHRNTFGGTLGGPIIHNKLFFFVSYQGVRVHDQGGSLSAVSLPPDLATAPDRSAGSLAAVANADFGTSLGAGDINPVALTLMNQKAASGGFFVPTPGGTALTRFNAGLQGFDTLISGPASTFAADQVNANMDYVFGPKDRMAVKYYFQRDPTTNPFGQSEVSGFPHRLDAGSQIASIDNTTVVSPNATWEQRVGYIRETAQTHLSQSLTPSDVGINLFSLNRFPTILIVNADGFFDPMVIGPTSNFAEAGIVQNVFDFNSGYTWLHGIHTVSFGFNFEPTQANLLSTDNQFATLVFNDFPSFLTGTLRSGLGNTQFLNGSSNRYYRAKELGLYVQDSLRIKSNLNVVLGLRWDWDGPLTEKYGLLANFYPQNYKYDLATDTVDNIGLVVAGNNRLFGTKGASDSTLTGRQWGIGPRIGIAWSPSFVKNFVVRAGFGMYYNRGEYFTYLGQSSASTLPGFSSNGPFSALNAPPFTLPIPATSSGTFQNPFGTTPPGPPPTSLAGVAALVPCQGLFNGGTCTSPQAPGATFPGLIQGGTPFLFGAYDPKNKLPYSENWTLDLQWQPLNTLLVDVGYVGNHGVHEVLPIPFNQPLIATPQNPVNGQIYSYGYDVPGVAAEQFNTSTGGNTDLRAPFLGYSANSMAYEAEGVSHYNALQANVTKRMGHGLSFTGSYTWSHCLDENSGTQLFYIGNNPRDPASAYGNCDFDRTHVFSGTYLYQLPDFVSSGRSGFLRQLANGWQMSGVTTLQSGFPYTVFDFSGGFGSIFYSINNFVTDPIVQVTSASQATAQGTLGVNPSKPTLNVNAFTMSTIPPGQMGVPPCDTSTTPPSCDTFETGFSTTGRNIFRGPFQANFDFAIAKNFKISERLNLRYDAQFFNIFNHPNFDIPNNDVAFNPFFSNPPTNVNTFEFGYTVPPEGKLGILQHTIGSPRFIQMALHLQF
jgi:Carboxypeptidase regulatory-like domain